MAKTTRGIRIALSRKSWVLICEALAYVVEQMADPLIPEHLGESRARTDKLLRHIRKKLDGPVAEQ